MITRTSTILLLSLLAGCVPSSVSSSDSTTTESSSEDSSEDSSQQETDAGEIDAECVTLTPIEFPTEAVFCHMSGSGLVVHVENDALWASQMHAGGTLEPVMQVGDLPNCNLDEGSGYAYDPATGKLWILSFDEDNDVPPLLSQYDSESATLEWEREFIDETYQLHSHALLNWDGGLYVAGVAYENSEYPPRWWVERLDASGATVWRQHPALEVGRDDLFRGAWRIFGYDGGVTINAWATNGYWGESFLATLGSEPGDVLWSRILFEVSDIGSGVGWGASDGDLVYVVDSQWPNLIRVSGLTHVGEPLWQSGDYPLPDMAHISDTRFAVFDEGAVMFSAVPEDKTPLHFVQWAQDGTIVCETDVSDAELGGITSFWSLWLGEALVLSVGDDRYYVVEPAA